jgi:hypothetical protein
MTSHGTLEVPPEPPDANNVGLARNDAAQQADEGPKETGGPAADWPHRTLYDNVRKTLFALPEEFTTSLHISDFRATDIFTLNSALGASIEDAVVRGLNALRDEWDPDGAYALYRFQRQAQAFPDVRLMTDAPNLEPILLGIELKGWFAVSKEGEPTFRYTITPDACAPQDLLVVYPWVLSDVVAGTPKLLPPFVGEARYAAELRNHYWRHMRQEKGKNGTVITATHRLPYPAVKTAQCSDRAEDDGGGNFGRVARYGLLDAFVRTTTSLEVSGIPVEAWLTFFRVFSDNTRTIEEVSPAVEGALRKFKGKTAEEQLALAEAFEHIAASLKDD